MSFQGAGANGLAAYKTPWYMVGQRGETPAMRVRASIVQAYREETKDAL